ncbi:MAG: ATP-binding cassette domain-containing protein [Methyloligellaceae bacterium]
MSLTEQVAPSPHTAERGDRRPAATFSDVAFSWPRAEGFVLRIEKFAVEKQEKLLIAGPSGSGKSTLLSLLCAIIAPQAGAVTVLGQDLSALSSAERDRFRAEHFGIIFQLFNLLPYGSILDNVLLPLSFAKMRMRRVDESGSPEHEARRLLSRLGLDEDIGHQRSATDLSVGQQQRVAAARALIGRPESIVADEPTSALDRNRQAAFLELLFEEVEVARATLVMVSHDETLAKGFDRLVNLSDIVTKTGAHDG